MTVLVFVYGTLKTGEPNHHLLRDKKRGLCRLVGTARTLEKYPLVITTKYNVPFMLHKQGIGQNIEGELYEVDEAQLELLDDLEKHPHWYERKEIRVLATGGPDSTSHGVASTQDDGRVSRRGEIIVQTYFLVKYQPGLLDLPTYSSYSCKLKEKPFILPYSDDDTYNTWTEVHSEAKQLIKMMQFGDHLKA